MKSISGKKSPNKKVVLVTILALVLVGVITVLFVDVMSKREDASRFTSAESKKDLLTQGIANYLGGNVVRSIDKNVCFNTEQGPYDNGKLWCQTATILELDHDLSYFEIGKEFIRVGEPLGLARAEEGVFPSYAVAIDEGMDCHLQFRDAEGDNFGSARRIPFDNDAVTVISVSCADRAKAKHYPYVN